MMYIPLTNFLELLNL